MRVPFLDLSRLHSSIADELESAYRATVAASSFVGGGCVLQFEREFAKIHYAPAGAACGSGTDALVLALRALGIRDGDEVVVPAMTFVATAEAVVHAGGVPVLADVDARTLLLSSRTVDAVRTSRTRAVIPVHLFGHVVPFDLLESWRRDGMVVLEDAAQAHLATWTGRSVGSAGSAACFSFYPGKNLGALGDGGCVISQDAQIVESVRHLRDHGRSTKYEHDQVGWCSRLDGLQAAFLSVKLRHLEDWTVSRRQLADHYRKRLGDLVVPWESGAVHHLLVVRVPNGERDQVQSILNEAGVETGVHYPIALSHQPSLKQWATPAPEAERAAGEVLSLPMDPMMTIGEVDYVSDVLGEALSGLSAS